MDESCNDGEDIVTRVSCGPFFGEVSRPSSKFLREEDSSRETIDAIFDSILPIMVFDNTPRAFQTYVVGVVTPKNSN
jgi:hypothetical protein